MLQQSLQLGIADQMRHSAREAESVHKCPVMAASEAMAAKGG